MDNEEIRDNWPSLKDRLQEKYPQLTADDLRYEIGKEGELLERLQEKLKQNWTEIRNVLSFMG